MRKQVGWDIGGAHLKAVLLNNDGQVAYAGQVPCALWLGLEHLGTAIRRVLKDIGYEKNDLNHAVTMTGELVDLFKNRHDGVVQISTLVGKLLGDHTLFYAMSESVESDPFFALHAVQEQTKMVASANWHTSATLLAQYETDAMLIDIGSTTTDIISIENSCVVDNGLSDATRMQADSLVYTGIVRTPVMAVAQKLMIDGKQANVAAEYFATMADVYRLTEELPEGADMMSTADGEAKTMLASARRLARMVGYDANDKPMTSWQQLANDCREKQIKQIQMAVVKQIKQDTKIIGAGIGVFLIEDIAQRLGQPYVNFSSLLNADIESDVCLPAYAVARLALLRGAV